MLQEVFVGVDVANDRLDTYHPGHAARRIENPKRCRRSL
jgi:hypothetical protein